MNAISEKPRRRTPSEREEPSPHFGLFGGVWSLDSFDNDGIILVNVGRRRGLRAPDGFVYDGNFLITVGRGRGIRVIHDFFGNDGDLGILVLFLTMLSPHSAEN